VVGFIAPFGFGNITFRNTVQLHYGGRGMGFYGVIGELNRNYFHVDEDTCNFGYSPPSKYVTLKYNLSSSSSSPSSPLINKSYSSFKELGD
jgi:hypothetical protein